MLNRIIKNIKDNIQQHNSLIEIINIHDSKDYFSCEFKKNYTCDYNFKFYIDLQLRLAINAKLKTENNYDAFWSMSLLLSEDDLKSDELLFEELMKDINEQINTLLQNKTKIIQKEKSLNIPLNV